MHLQLSREVIDTDVNGQVKQLSSSLPDILFHCHRKR